MTRPTPKPYHFVLKDVVEHLENLDGLRRTGIVTVISTHFLGIIPFAFLLPAGIVELRHTTRTVATT